MQLYTLILATIVILSLSALTNAEEKAAVAAKATGEPDKVYINRKKREKKFNASRIEADWKDGDAEEELEEEHDRLERIRERVRPKFDMKDPESLKRAYKKDPSTFGTGEGMAGQSMIFVKLRAGKDQVKSEREIELIARKWTTLLQSGGIFVKIYNPDKNTIIVHVERGWLTKETLKFVAAQQETETFTLNQKKFTPKQYMDELEEDEEGRDEEEEDEDEDDADL